jgi:hypothetical protein
MTEPLPIYTKCPGSSLFGSWQRFISFLETTRWSLGWRRVILLPEQDGNNIEAVCREFGG